MLFNAQTKGDACDRGVLADAADLRAGHSDDGTMVKVLPCHVERCGIGGRVATTPVLIACKSILNVFSRDRSLTSCSSGAVPGGVGGGASSNPARFRLKPSWPTGSCAASAAKRSAKPMNKHFDGSESG
jgi:hypothetical protein